MEDTIFEVNTPLGFSVHCTRKYWKFIIEHKHPILCGKEQEVERTLADPDEVRRSRKDYNVLLFYRNWSPRWLCAVAKQEDTSGFLITAYPANVIKIGDLLWKKSK
ncbi:MAG: DUF4258 domain-containing protein [Nitrospirae bacterium]|nr:MAG: DUF4258 domain-containing protein [Nitrospirota bacterium]